MTTSGKRTLKHKNDRPRKSRGLSRIQRNLSRRKRISARIAGKLNPLNGSYRDAGKSAPGSEQCDVTTPRNPALAANGSSADVAAVPLWQFQIIDAAFSLWSSFRMEISQSKLSGVVATRRANAADIATMVHMLWDDEQGRQRESISQDQASIYRSAFDQIERDPNSQVLVATIDDTVIGCLQLTIIPGLSYQGIKRALVEDVRVAKSHRGQGIGHQMLAFAEAQATDLGCGLIELFVHEGRGAAHRFYESAGYIGAHRGFRKKLASG